MSIPQRIPLTNGEVPKLTVIDYSASESERKTVTPSSHENLHRSSDDRRCTTATPTVRSSAQKPTKKSIARFIQNPVSQSRTRIVPISRKLDNHKEEVIEDSEQQDEDEGLGDVLRKVGHRHSDIRVKYFWTDDVLVETMTKPCIVAELQRYQEENRAPFAATSIERIADDIITHRRKIFAVLALLDKGACIEQVIAEGLTDKDLPLHTDGSSSCSLYRVVNSQNRKVNCFSLRGWRTLHRETFFTSQYAMNPQFLGFDSDGRTPKHEEFSPGVVLPITKEEEGHQGGYGVIKKIKLAPTCHGFHDRLRLVRITDLQ